MHVGSKDASSYLRAGTAEKRNLILSQILIHSIESVLQNLPEPLRSQLNSSIAEWLERSNTVTPVAEFSPELSSSLAKVWATSSFVAESCIRNPGLFIDLINSGDLLVEYAEDDYKKRLAKLDVRSSTDLMMQLRYFRRREMVRIAWRDLSGWADLMATLLELSWLAEACIQYALDFLYQEACQLRGTPVLSDGSPQQLVVLGMGKLGAYELNFSSDIDLIFAFAEEGVLADRKQTTYGEFFSKLCRQLIKTLDEITVDGFVFRTDIRLRPYGDSGPVIMTFDGMENYYQTQAREWERYAMIKARQVAGDFKIGAQLMAMLKPFVYRRYLDYGAFEELRSLKAQITQELKRKDRLDNIKLGQGGIREIEFIGQAFQLIRGGNDKSLQARGILEILTLLGEKQLLAETDAGQLRLSYIFLRQVENHIQQYQDRQTHDLPKDRIAQQALAFSMGYADWDSFINALDKVRSQVHAIFDQVFSLSKIDNIHIDSQKVWACVMDDSELIQQLGELGIQNPQSALEQIKQFKSSSAIRRLTTKGAGVLDRLMPQLFEALKTVGNPDETLKRLLKLFESVAGRNVYLSLLAENSGALAQLIKLSSASLWICDYLARYPVLFDELLDTRTLYEPLKRDDLDRQLESLLDPIEIEDLESLMVALRQFKQLNVLRVAAADIMGAIPLMVVSDYLTYIAESAVAQVVNRAWLMLVAKHGWPPNTNQDHIGFAVLGLGKFGGIELGYGSDLDLVFLSDYQHANAMTNGDKPISCAQFYSRLGLKVRHILDTKLLSGVLYDVDMRLRPNGDSGLLVTDIRAYEEYLAKEAWTWELQALVRGRFIAGDPSLQLLYEAIRRRILSLPRDSEHLKSEVREMREKMRTVLAMNTREQFDLKHSRGGIADIEFIVQFGILDRAAAAIELTVYTDNVRLLEGLQHQGFISNTEMEILKAAYCFYRDIGHKLVLQGDKAIIAETEVAKMSAQVEQIWLNHMA